jgi:hypothetical protein
LSPQIAKKKKFKDLASLLKCSKKKQSVALAESSQHSSHKCDGKEDKEDKGDVKEDKGDVKEDMGDVKEDMPKDDFMGDLMENGKEETKENGKNGVFVTAEVKSEKGLTLIFSLFRI